MSKYVEGRDYMEMPGSGRLGGPVDLLALIAELQAEKAGLERIIEAQSDAIITLHRELEAVGAGGVSPLMGGAKDVEIARLREALTHIECEPINAEYIARAALTQQEQA